MRLLNLFPDCEVTISQSLAENVKSSEIARRNGPVQLSGFVAGSGLSCK
jgi:predicted alpha-1,6-mannanase (GH76 family)